MSDDSIFLRRLSEKSINEPAVMKTQSKIIGLKEMKGILGFFNLRKTVIYSHK